jgi:hypothetical protein
MLFIDHAIHNIRCLSIKIRDFSIRPLKKEI